LAQLFLVPLLIVLVLVVLAVAGLWWSKGRYAKDEVPSTDHYLRDLENANADIRWRAAHELAQVIKRPESLLLASSPKFALDLADRLQRELAGLRIDEQAEHERTKNLSTQEQAAARRKLVPERELVLFLTSALGDFTLPTSVPLLSEIALEDKGPDVKSLALRRRRAVWALANLGENQKRFAQLSPEQQARILEKLKAEAAGEGQRAVWARLAHDHLTRGVPLGVDATLEKCARAEDSYLRSLVALALNFWDGPRTEPTLRALSYDDGHGTRVEITEKD
jgi:hypothetical protein